MNFSVFLWLISFIPEYLKHLIFIATPNPGVLAIKRLSWLLFSSIFLTGCVLQIASPTKTSALVKSTPVAMESLVAYPSPTPALASVTATLPASPSSTPSATIQPTSTPTPAPAFEMCSPLAWETIPELWEIVSDPYHPPPPERAEERHHGVDFSHYSRKGNKTIEGEPVQAILAGRVAAAIQDRLPYGNMVIVETASSRLPLKLKEAIQLGEGQSLYLLYAHMKSAPEVKLGDSVDCGQVLGEVGMTGYNEVNPHLHLEARRGPPGATFPSMTFYTTAATLEEMDTYRRWRTGGEFQHFDPMQLFQAYLDFLTQN